MKLHGKTGFPAVPRLAATILLLRDDPFQVLMIRRHPDQVFASALVFPGGVVEESDRSEAWLDLIEDSSGDADMRALKIAGFRETFEGTGILLARDANGYCTAPVTCDAGSFMDTVRASGGRLILDDLVRFGHWITPEPLPKRFDTHFFVCRAAPGQDGICDEREAVELEWARPRDILDRAAAGESAIMFPTRLNVQRLAESSSAEEAFLRARTTSVFTVLPKVERRPGGAAVTIPEEAGYGETENFQPDRN